MPQEATNNGKRKISLILPSFTVICVFVVLMIIGMAILPLLNVRLEPSRAYKSVSIYYEWNKASADMVEDEVTSKIEAILATVKGISSLNSTSGKGFGRIFASLDKNVKVREVQYEISTLLRQLFPHLPLGVTYPLVTLEKPFENKALLSYNIIGNADANSIQQFVVDDLKPQLTSIVGVEEVKIYGVKEYVWKLHYEPTFLNKYNISLFEIESAVKAYFFKADLGKANFGLDEQHGGSNYAYLTLKTNNPENINWNKILIKKQAGRVIYLVDVVKVSYEELQSRSYYRINGQNAITLEVIANKQVNSLAVSDSVKEKTSSLIKRLPDGSRLNLAYDATDFLAKEFDKVVLRSLITLAVLFVFILLISRQPRYLLLILISLVSNLLLAFIFYYSINLEIHLYSLAGITVSIGMIIDNSIVVIDHIHHKNNLKVIPAVTGASLTTIGAISVVFFLNDEQQIKLLDFAWIMIINLLVSLINSFFFIPALLEKLPLNQIAFKASAKRKRNIINWNRIYARLINFGVRFKKCFGVFIVLLFGLPVFMLPTKMEGVGIFNKIYNITFGSEIYNSSIRPVADRALGGALRLFLNEKREFAFANKDLQKTSLIIKVNMPYGTRLKLTDAIVTDFESFLSRFNEVKQFQSHIGDRYALISVDFKPEYEMGTFPYELKTQLEEKAVSTGLAEFSIFGVGDGFNNSVGLQNNNAGLTLLGYNYESLLKYAGRVSDLLKRNMRVEKVFIGSKKDNEGESANYEFVFNIINQEKLLVNYLSSTTINRSLMNFSANEKLIDMDFLGKVAISPIRPSASIWEIMHEPISSDSLSYIRLKEFASMEKEKMPTEIFRENQQYQVVVNYNFIGDYSQSEMTAKGIIKKISAELPVGYVIKQNTYNFWTQDGARLTWTVILTIAIVFLICSVLLNSISQPLAVICMIPISFIGVFLSTWIFKYQFDEGGYAALIVLCGIVVNAALYILNDYNNFRKDFRRKIPKTLFIKAYNSKIIPILLSSISVILSLAPFIFFTKGDAFWYALAMSITGGVIFSLFAILIFLPILLIKSPKFNPDKLRYKSKIKSNNG